MQEDGIEPVELHFPDLRRSAHYLMRNAGVDGQTRCDIMRHEGTSMDDEAIEDAGKMMEIFQKQRGLLTEDRATR